MILIWVEVQNDSIGDKIFHAFWQCPLTSCDDVVASPECSSFQCFICLLYFAQILWVKDSPVSLRQFAFR